MFGFQFHIIGFRRPVQCSAQLFPIQFICKVKPKVEKKLKKNEKFLDFLRIRTIYIMKADGMRNNEINTMTNEQKQRDWS